MPDLGTSGPAVQGKAQPDLDTAAPEQGNVALGLGQSGSDQAIQRRSIKVNL